MIFGTPFCGGSDGLPNSGAWGGCEAEPPGLTLVIILFRAGIETRMSPWESREFASQEELVKFGDDSDETE